jgi:four helix bundle protein
MDNGRWTMDNGRWTMDNGQWTMDDGRWTMDDGQWTMDDGQWTMDDGILNYQIKITMAFKFEGLRVWQMAVDMSVTVHQLTKQFPKDELYVLTSQMKRATDSITLNIAEGSQGQSDAEQKKFLGYALRSAIEVVCALHLAQRRDLIDQTQFNSTIEQITALIKSIQAFRNAIK